MHAGGRGSHGALVGCEDCLVALGVLGFDLFAHPFRQGRFAEREEGLLELFVGTVEKEAQGTSAGCGVVDDLGHEQVVVSEIELVPDADLACGIHEHVPEAQVAVQFAQEEDFDLRAGFLLVSVEACGEDLRVVEHEEVFLLEVVEDLLENAVFDGSGLAVYDHQSRLVAVFGRVFGQHFGREVVPVLR